MLRTELSYSVNQCRHVLYLSFVKKMNSCFIIYCITDKPKLPDNFKDATWGKLKEAVCAIQNKTSISSSLEDLYKAVENMCSHKMSSLLYNELKAECVQHVKSRLSQFTGYPFYLIILYELNDRNSAVSYMCLFGKCVSEFKFWSFYKGNKNDMTSRVPFLFRRI